MAFGVLDLGISASVSSLRVFHDPVLVTIVIPFFVAIPMLVIGPAVMPIPP